MRQCTLCSWLEPALLILMVLGVVSANTLQVLDMDEKAVCSANTVFVVYDTGVRLNARGTTAPANPPLECTVRLLSTYREKDGTNKLQIKVEYFTARSCEMRLNIYNGHTASGRYVQSFGCDNQYSSVGIFYSNDNEITIRMTRPDDMTENKYQFSLLVKPWKDPNATPTEKNVDKLPIAAIIGITFACLVVIGIIILFCWCCCTGRLERYSGRVIRFPARSYANEPGKVIMHSQQVVGNDGKPGVLNINDPQVWNTITTGRYEPGRNSGRYQTKQSNNLMLGRRFERSRPQAYEQNRMSGHDYEPYDVDARQGRSDDRDYQTQRRSPQESKKPRKETLIDDVFDSDSDKTGETDIDDGTLKKRPPDSPVPEEENLPKGSPQLERYLSMDLASQPDQDTISSPLHINAGVRASVDDEAGSPSGSLRRKKKGDKSPQSMRRGNGKGGPDPMALPPEAFEPIFTKPIEGIDYQGSNRQLHNQPPGFPGGFIPYGFVPTGAFAPGTQTYAYAYQTVPQQGAPGQQGAWFVQNTPTNDGNRRTAFAVQETINSPDRRDTTPERRRRKNSDPFRKGGPRGAKDPNPDLSIIARGAAPPDPGRGHRSIEMKSGTDPNSKVHTTQVTWTDTVPDATDPKPDDENPQITRKTITRVTTKSGHGDLPQHATLLALEDSDPAFLSPSSRTRTPPPAILPPAASTPASENLAFYTGASVPPPERTAAEPSAHNAPSYHSAIRDRIPIDSTV